MESLFIIAHFCNDLFSFLKTHLTLYQLEVTLHVFKLSLAY